MVDMLFRSVRLVLEVSWMISPFGDVIRNTFRKKRTTSSLNFVNVGYRCKQRNASFSSLANRREGCGHHALKDGRLTFDKAP